MKAHHIIGLTSLETGKYLYSDDPRAAKIKAAIANRFDELKAAGHITARRHLPQAQDAPGRSTWEDDLAGDDQYIFLSIGSRYIQGAGVAFGFIFDAEDLIRKGAILGIHDLASDYTSIVGQVAEEVAATLPRLPRIAEQELDEFMEMMGEDDPRMRQFISDNSTNPESELLDALRDGEEDYPGYRQAVTLIHKRITELHRVKRLTGDAAIIHLQQHIANGQMEILVRDTLPLAWATSEIRHGKIT